MKRVASLLVVVLLSVALTCLGADYDWNDAAGGELGDPGKWTPTGPPGVDDYVYFNLPNSYTIWLDDYYDFGRMTVEGSDLTLDLNGYECILDTTDDYNQSVIIGDETPSTLTLLGGSVLCRDLFTGKSDEAAVGTLNLSDGALLSGNVDYAWHGFYFGTSGDSVVTVTDGAFLEHGRGQSGIYRSAEFLFDGENTEWYVDDYFDMSVYGTTRVDLSNSARARIGYLKMGCGPHSSATINLTGVSQQTELAIENWWEPINLYVGMSGKGVISLLGSHLYVTSGMAMGSQAGESRGVEYL